MKIGHIIQCTTLRQNQLVLVVFPLAIAPLLFILVLLNMKIRVCLAGRIWGGQLPLS